MNWRVGDRIERNDTGKIFEITRIAPAGANGTSHLDGPTYYATIVVDGQVVKRGFTATIWSKSMSFPTHAYTLLEN